MCEVGIEGTAFGLYGEKITVHTGDICIIWHGNYVGTDIENWIPSEGLTAIVANQFRNYTNGIVEELPHPLEVFAMGIKSCMQDKDEWRVQIVKKYYNVIDGENWPNYGFSYHSVD